MAITNKRVLSVKKDFDMSTANSCVFHHSQWESCQEEEHASISYLIYRVLFMIFFIASLTFSTLCQSHLYHIFLTNWSFTLQTLYGILFCCNIMYKKRSFLGQALRLKFNNIYPESSNIKAYELKETNTWGNTTDNILNGEGKEMMTCVNIDSSNNTKDEERTSSITDLTTTDSTLRKSDIAINANNNNINDSPSLLEKVIWVLMNVTHVLPHIVVLGYWMFVYKYDPDQRSCVKFRSHFIVHGATSVVALIDALIVAVPARKSHFIFPSFIIAVYALFSYIYEVAGGPYKAGNQFIYSILNWRHKKLRSLLIVTVGVILSPLAHLTTCWGVHYVRLKLFSWYKNMSTK